jgi:phytoene desaturase
MARDRTAAVIGAGIAGLAVATRLARQGFHVTVFEANGTPGGKVAELRTEGFRFDMGPSVLTMPQYIDELFELCGEDPREHFPYQRLDPVFRYFYADGTELVTPADPDRLADELASKTSVKREQVLEFLRRSKEKMELTDPVFLQRSLHRWRNYLDRATLRGVLNFHKVEAFTTMARSNARHFRDAKVEQLFNSYASYNGSDPYQAPATLNLISHYEVTLGAFHCAGGMYTIARELTALAQRQGVTFHFGAAVERINVGDGKARGVTVNGEELRFGTVVSNADINTTYDRLLPGQHRPSITLDRPKSSSVIVFFWGMGGIFPRLHVHNMFLAPDPRDEYRHIFRLRDVCDDPTVYVHVSSKVNTSDAPEGCENWFVMVSVPHDTGQDWPAIVMRTRANVLRRLQSQLGEDVSPFIRCEQVMAPPDIAHRTSSHLGAVFGNSSNGMFSAFLRHPNFSSGIGGLYFCGGSVHPGSGIPLCLLSAKITAGMVGLS